MNAPPKKKPEDLDALRDRQADDEEREDLIVETATAFVVAMLQHRSIDPASADLSPYDHAAGRNLAGRAFTYAQALHAVAGHRRALLAEAHRGQRNALRQGKPLAEQHPITIFLDHAVQQPQQPAAPAPAAGETSPTP